MSLRLVWSNSLSEKRFSVSLARVQSFGTVCRDLRIAAGLSQTEVADAGGLEQSRISEIERDKYLPGLDLAVRLAKGLGVTLTDIVARWEGTAGDSATELGRRRGVRRAAAAPLDVSQEDLFRRVRGLWELMSPELRDEYLKHGKKLVAEEWKAEQRGAPARSTTLEDKPRQREAVRRAR